MQLRTMLLAALIGGLGLTTQSVGARDRDGGGLFGAGDVLQPGKLIDRSPRLSPGQAAREAQRQYGGGKVLSVDPAGDGYRVKLLREGDVRIVFIPDR